MLTLFLPSSLADMMLVEFSLMCFKILSNATASSSLCLISESPKSGTPLMIRVFSDELLEEENESDDGVATLGLTTSFKGL